MSARSRPSDGDPVGLFRYTRLPMARTHAGYRIVQRISIEGVLERDRAEGPTGPVLLSRIRRSAPEMTRRALLEAARIAQKVDIEPVVRLLDVGEDPAPGYFVHERVPGADLRSLFNEAFRQRRSLPIPISVQIVADAARGLGLASAWSGGATHGDVSPRHLILGRDGRGRIADFAVAGALLESLGGPEATGRFSYCAPERIRGAPADPRSDVFGLGVVLFETTTGARLFKRPEPAATRAAILAGSVRSPRDALPGYPRELERIVLEALQPAPDARWSSALDFADALESFVVERGIEPSRDDMAAFLEALVPTPAHEEAAGADPETLPALEERPKTRPGRRSGSDGPALSVVEAPRVGGARRSPRRPPPDQPPLPIPELSAQPQSEMGVSGDVPTEPDPETPPDEGLGDGPDRPADASETSAEGAAPEPMARIPISLDREAAEVPVAETDRIRRRPRARPRRLAGVGLLLATVGGLGAVTAYVERDEPPPEPAAPIVATTEEPPKPSPEAPGVDPEPPSPAPGGRRSGVEAGPPGAPTEGGEVGRLKVIVQPWGRVRVDGWDYGLTPVPLIELAPGRHRVEVKNEDSGHSWKGEIEVGAGTTEELRVKLRSLD